MLTPIIILLPLRSPSLTRAHERSSHDEHALVRAPVWPHNAGAHLPDNRQDYKRPDGVRDECCGDKHHATEHDVDVEQAQLSRGDLFLDVAGNLVKEARALHCLACETQEVKKGGGAECGLQGLSCFAALPGT